MVARTETPAVQSLEMLKNEQIQAPIDIVWETLLEQIGPASEGEHGPMPMKLEAWPGGRWYRDLGNDTGHFWGHVQVIKPPKLLELCGPMFMSYAATSHVQYRLAEEGSGTLLKCSYTAIGLIKQEHREGVEMGWSEELQKVREAAEKKAAQRRGKN